MALPGWLRRSAQVVVMREGRALFLLRGTTAPWAPGLFGLPGGHVEPGEQHLDAARRELREETGLIMGWSRRLGAGRQRAFLAEGFGPVRLLDGEHDAWVWVEPAEASTTLRLAPGVAAILRRAAHLGV